MHTASTAHETLQFLQANYRTAGEQVDFDMMRPETFEAHVQRNSPVRPFRIRAWMIRQGYFISAWALWEHYSRALCDSLPIKEKESRSGSTVEWVGKSVAANNLVFN